MSQRNNQTARHNPGAFSKAIQRSNSNPQQSKPIGTWNNLMNKTDRKPGVSKIEKANFLNGFAIGMIAGIKLPELQGLKGANGDPLDKIPAFNDMTDEELDSWINKYGTLVEKL